jgi:predicted nuclease with TOPRIM domain
MEKFTQPNNNENKYLNTTTQELQQMSQDLKQRYENLTEESVNLDEDLDINMHAQEVLNIQNKLIEIEQEIIKRTENN